MRFAIFTVTLLLLAGPVLGQTNVENNNGLGHAFGSANCSPPVPCPDDASTISSDDLVANANACITRYFGYSSSSGFFDNIAGLNNNCLSPLPGILPKGVGQQLSPHCCIMQYPDNSCAFHCDLITVQ